MQTISNEILSVSVSEDGAQMMSLKAKGKEYLWQGDPQFWGGRSPILFPNIGAVWQNTYRYKEQTYTIPKHGFAKSMRFDVVAQQVDRITLRLQHDEQTLTCFPFAFELLVSYVLEGSKVRCLYEVRNLGSDTMYFQIGGHPGFNLFDFDADADRLAYIGLGDGTKQYIQVGDGGCANPDKVFTAVTEQGLLPITAQTFDNDALMFENHQVPTATLYNNARLPLVSLHTDAPVLAFWAPSGGQAPFVCFEPWFGRCDRHHFHGTLEQRDWIQRAESGAVWCGHYDIEIL